jgi:hypothetical protein
MFVEIEPEENLQAEIVKKFNPATVSVNELKDRLPDFTTQQLEDVLQAETSGKNRYTAIAAIKASIEAKSVLV